MSKIMEICTTSDHAIVEIDSGYVADNISELVNDDVDATRAYLEALHRELQQAVLDRFLATVAAKR